MNAKLDFFDCGALLTYSRHTALFTPPRHFDIVIRTDGTCGSAPGRRHGAAREMMREAQQMSCTVQHLVMIMDAKEAFHANGTGVP